MQPKTRYARSGDVHIAYQVVGEGPLTIVWVPTWISNLEILWEEPLVVRFFERLASFSRLVIYDRRGTGLSDPVGCAPTLEDQMDDIHAVMDAARVDRAGLLAITEGGPLAAMFAASFPERAGALVLYGAMSSLVAVEDVPWAYTPEQRELLFQEMAAAWGEGARLPDLAPSLADDPAFRRWFGRLERFAASPGTVVEMMRITSEIDIRAVLPTIRVPTLVLHRTEDQLIDPRHSRYLAERIPGARLVELPGRDSIPVAGDSDAILDEVEEFLTGVRRGREPDRVLATVMFTDIVDSTTHAARLGDHRWRDLLESHHAVVRQELDRFRGREVKTTGDGFLATFDGPARAIRAAAAIREGVRRLGIEIRAGLHTGEVEMIGEDVGGLAVHIGARVGALAGGGEVLVSSTVRDLVVGSGIAFADRGVQQLKGVPGEWRLFAADA